MGEVFKYPVLVLVLSLVVLWVSARIGIALRRRRDKLSDEEREDFNVIVGASLTLLSLIIGFTFSMAISRYDQRKVLEEAEANAIGTEYVRADILPAGDAQRVRTLLKSYLDQRMLFYTTRGHENRVRIDADTARLQSELWTAVQVPASAQPNPVMALAVSGMNDVLNSQGYTQAAWWNRIPDAAWTLMVVIAIGCNLLVGYVRRNAAVKTFHMIVLPLVVSVSFFLIADIDSPRHGIIRVVPQNLEALAKSLPPH